MKQSSNPALFYPTCLRIFILLLMLPGCLCYSQWLDAYIPDFKVNDDNLNSYQTNSVIGVDTAGNFVIAWNDVRNMPGNQSPLQIYCQRYNKDGVALGNNFRIGQDTAGIGAMTMLKDGRFILTWVRFFYQSSVQHYEFYYQRFDKNAQALTNPLRVIDSSFFVQYPIYLQGFNIASDSLGKFVICWSKGHDFFTKTKVFFQRFDSSGAKIGEIDSVNEANSNAEFPSVAMNYDGSFVVAWQDDRIGGTGVSDIFMQRYTNSGIKIGNNIKVNDDNSPSVSHTGSDIGTNGFGYSVISWTDRRNSENSIYYQLYKSDGSLLGSNKKANILSAQFSRSSSRVTVRKDRYFFIGWLDIEYSGGREQFYGRRFDSLGNSIGNPYMIPMSSISPNEQRINEVYLLGDKVYGTWTSFIGMNNNTDIYCNVRGFQNPDTVIGIVNTSEIANEFMLYSPYPNPFNPATKIKYQIAAPSFPSKGGVHVLLKVFDVTGREISELVNEYLKPGIYEITFNGSSLSSGIYFVKLMAESGYTHTKKLILIK